MRAQSHFSQWNREMTRIFKTITSTIIDIKPGRVIFKVDSPAIETYLPLTNIYLSHKANETLFRPSSGRGERDTQGSKELS